MKLTEKAKEHFVEWYNSNVAVENEEVKSFLRLPESMQWGVIQDWADRLGFDMTVEGSVDDNLNYTTDYEWSILKKSNNSNHYNHSVCKTRQEARNAAIEKLNEIINQNK